MSSLDIGTSQRAAIKRRLSDSNRAVHSTKLKLQMRMGSLSPTNDVSCMFRAQSIDRRLFLYVCKQRINDCKHNVISVCQLHSRMGTPMLRFTGWQ